MPLPSAGFSDANQGKMEFILLFQYLFLKLFCLVVLLCFAKKRQCLVFSWLFQQCYVCSLFCRTAFLAFALRYLDRSFSLVKSKQAAVFLITESEVLLSCGSFKFWFVCLPYVPPPFFLPPSKCSSLFQVCFINHNGILEYNSP